ncbi:acyl-CoA/acyl-ACP dehydrogenase [Alphaproteobacteria bacterium]|nr:acyl-CoA/acyl-ACP dehydrogenase [Alphaproteobacteria bacterium]
MDFDLPEELQMLKDNLRRFVDTELIPIERETNDGSEFLPGVQQKLEEKAKALGLWLFDVPEEFGGMGLGHLSKAVMFEEMSRTIALPSRGASIFGPRVSPILYTLNDEQKERFLFPVIRGEKTSCFLQTEPEGGGDPGGMRTTAVRDGDHYVVNGHKRFITGAGGADFGQVVTATDREKGSRGGLTVFLVDMDTPGITKLRQQDMMIADRPWEILFEDVKIPVGQRVGEEGDGMRAAQSWLTEGRLRHGARGAGVIERCLELAASYSNQRSTFGAKLSARQTIQNMLVDMYQNLHQLRLMVYNAAWRADQGQDVRKESYMCKYFGDEMSFSAADRCMQIHGGMGLTKDLPIEQFFRDQRSMVITEGPTEILKMALARQVLREYGE